jgi:ferredoxin-NADP reductase
VTRFPRPSAWQPARVISIREETHRVKSIRFEVTEWPGHLAGQHADVRLTADDGYRAERSYSIASPPEDAAIELTVDPLEDGEVSPYLTSQLQPGDTIQLRGPIGGHFAWSAVEAPRPLLLIGGGSGVVPLMCMLRHRKNASSTVPTALLYSSRTRGDVIFHAELMALAQGDPAFSLQITLTRDSAPGWSGRTGRIDLSAVQRLMDDLGGSVDAFVCGPDAFVEAAAELLVEAGQPQHLIRTERFGATGGIDERQRQSASVS